MAGPYPSSPPIATLAACAHKESSTDSRVATGLTIPSDFLHTKSPDRGGEINHGRGHGCLAGGRALERERGAARRRAEAARESAGRLLAPRGLRRRLLRIPIWLQLRRDA